jgi:MATE family, multidrug efflux pump
MVSAPLPLSWSGHLKATVALGLPIIGSLVAQMAIGLTDTVMVGWYGVDELAAVVLATSIFFVFFLVGSGFAMAVMPMVASAEGEGDKAQVRRVVRMGLWISALFCAVSMPILWQFEALMLLIGQDPGTAALSQEYMRIAQWGIFPAMLIMVLKSFLSALERPAWVLWGTILGAIANALLNYALIFGNWGAPELGVKGAAVASVATGMITFGVLALYTRLNAEFAPYAIFNRLWRSDWPAFGAVFRLGWPIGTTMLAEVGLFSAAAIMMGWIGTRELATHGIVIQIASMSFMVYLGLANVVTVRSGRALGRQDRTGIWRAVVTATGLQLAMSVLVISAFVLMPELLIGFFLDQSNPDSAAIIAYGVGLLLVAAAFQVVDGVQVVALAVLRGLKDTRVPMICALVSYWGIGMPVSYLLGFRMGYGGYGIWAGLVIGLALAAVSLLARFFWLFGRMR